MIFFVTNSGSFYDEVISCNDKTIAVNRIRKDTCAKNILEEEGISLFDINGENEFNKINTKSDKINTNYKSVCTNSLKNIHNYNIESLSNFNDYFISIDYLRVNLWNIHNLKHCYSLLDCKPQKYEDMEYVITKGLLKNNLFSYGTSNGEVFINDLRIKNNNQIKVILKKGDDIYEELLKIVHDFVIIDDNLVIRDMNSVHFYDLRNIDNSNTMVLDKLSEEYLEEQFTNSSVGSYKLKENNSFFYTGGRNGLVYKINNSDVFLSYQIETEENVELIGVNEGFVYAGVEENLYSIEKEAFSEKL